MTVAIFVAPHDGQFSASLAGAPELRAVRSTRGEAIDALKAEIQKRMEAGELIPVEIPPRGVAALAGVFSDDPTLREICEEAYRDRDAELSP
jgi:hypothetical protein